MFNRILVPVDGSDTAASAAAYALRLAEAFDSTVLGLYVVDVRLIEGPLLQTIGTMWGDVPIPARQDDFLEALESRGRDVLDDFEQRAETAGGTFESMLEIGVVSDVIADRARSVDLVVIGRRGEHAAFGEHPLGSTVHSVVRRAPKPVLVCPRGSEPLERPLVAYDGSEHAARALELAVEYAERRECPLHMVTVQGRAEDAERLLAEAEEFARGHGLDPVSHARESEKVVEMILEVLREAGADLLVMGAYGKSRLREFLLGSTTEEILARSEHPVLLYR